MAVERFDFLGDREVLVGDGLVGDAGVDHCHRQSLVTEQRGDRFEARAPVDCLGGEGVAKLVRGHVADPGVGGDAAQRVGNTQLGDGSAVLEQEPVAAQPDGSVVCDPVVEQVFEVGVEWDVAVVVELADRDPHPERGTDLNDGIDGEAEEFAEADTGAGKDQDTAQRRRCLTVDGSDAQSQGLSTIHRVLWR